MSYFEKWVNAPFKDKKHQFNRSNVGGTNVQLYGIIPKGSPRAFVEWLNESLPAKRAYSALLGHFGLVERGGDEASVGGSHSQR